MILIARFLIFLILLYPLSAPYAEEIYKLGAVDAVRILEQSPEREVAKKLIEEEFSPRDQEILADQKKVAGARE